MWPLGALGSSTSSANAAVATNDHTVLTTARRCWLEVPPLPSVGRPCMSGGRRRIVWIAAVTDKLSEAEYHADLVLDTRNTVVYKWKADALAHRQRRKYSEALYPPGQNGPTVVSTSYTRFPTDLTGAPFLPKRYNDSLTDSNFGRDRVCSPELASYFVSAFRRMRG